MGPAEAAICIELLPAYHQWARLPFDAIVDLSTALQRRPGLSKPVCPLRDISVSPRFEEDLYTRGQNGAANGP